MATDIVKGLNAARSVRRGLAIAIIVAAFAFLGFLAYSTWRLSESNDWSEILHVVGTPVAWLVLALVTAVFAVITERSDRKHAVAVATVGATAAGADMSEPRVVASRPWRGSALAGLAVLAFSLSLVSSSQLGQLRSETDFGLRKKENVPLCTQRECSPAEKSAAQAPPCNGATPCVETIEACVATLSAPSTASTEDQIPIDLSVYCRLAKAQQMPDARATYAGGGPTATSSFANAKTTLQNQRVWRWYVKFPKGEQPVDVRMSFVGDVIAVPLVRIRVSPPTTIAGLQESTTALGGLLTALVGLFGTIGALIKGLSARSATVVMPAAATTDASPN